MTITLWRNGEVSSAVSLIYLGEDVVLETDGVGKPTPHYFESTPAAKEFIIKQAYALLSLGYEVHG